MLRPKIAVWTIAVQTMEDLKELLAVDFSNPRRLVFQWEPHAFATWIDYPEDVQIMLRHAWLLQKEVVNVSIYVGDKLSEYRIDFRQNTEDRGNTSFWNSVWQRKNFTQTNVETGKQRNAKVISSQRSEFFAYSYDTIPKSKLFSEAVQKVKAQREDAANRIAQRMRAGKLAKILPYSFCHRNLQLPSFLERPSPFFCCGVEGDIDCKESEHEDLVILALLCNRAAPVTVGGDLYFSRSTQMCVLVSLFEHIPQPASSKSLWACFSMAAYNCCIGNKQATWSFMDMLAADPKLFDNLALPQKGFVLNGFDHPPLASSISTTFQSVIPPSQLAFRLRWEKQGAAPSSDLSNAVWDTNLRLDHDLLDVTEYLKASAVGRALGVDTGRYWPQLELRMVYKIPLFGDAFEAFRTYSDKLGSVSGKRLPHLHGALRELAVQDGLPPHEIYALHGTSWDTVGKIVKGGFDKKYCSDGMALGRGLYFADHISKAIDYVRCPHGWMCQWESCGEEDTSLAKMSESSCLCPGHGDTLFPVLLCRVAVGRVKLMYNKARQLVAPPEGFDSCAAVSKLRSMDSKFTFPEYVVYRNAAAFPVMVLGCSKAPVNFD